MLLQGTAALKSQQTQNQQPENSLISHIIKVLPQPDELTGYDHGLFKILTRCF